MQNSIFLSIEIYQILDQKVNEVYDYTCQVYKGSSASKAPENDVDDYIAVLQADYEKDQIVNS